MPVLFRQSLFVFRGKRCQKRMLCCGTCEDNKRRKETYLRGLNTRLLTGKIGLTSKVEAENDVCLVIVNYLNYCKSATL